MFLDLEAAIGDLDLDHVADEAVRVFLAAYARVDAPSADLEPG